MNRLYQLCSIALLPVAVSAGIVTDGTLGAAQSLTGPHFAVTADLGRREGANLFHSFSQFSIANGESATFNGPPEIANIISRVTGGDISTIDGALRSNIIGANLFLLNPAGVIFGPNASLDISGSLHVSSADYLALGEQMERFLATPLESEILSAAAPTAFGFLGSSAGAIQLDGASLTLASGNALTLAANGVELDYAETYIDQGTVVLAGIAGEGEVAIETGIVDTNSSPGDITINQSSIIVDGADGGGGRIMIHGGQFMLQDSELFARTGGDLAGKGVEITADDTTLIDSEIYTYTMASGNAGSVMVESTRFYSESSYIVANTYGAGDAGKITLTMSERLELSGNSQVDSDTLGGAGSGGIITVSANELIMRDDTDIDSVARSTGNAGKITITVDTLQMSEFAEIETNAYDQGNAGTITLIVSERLELSGNSQVASDGRAAGKGGTIIIDTNELIMRDSTDIDAEVSGSGDAGEITITANRLQMLDFAEIENRTYDQGDAGTITLMVSERVELSGNSQIAGDSDGDGKGGTIIIDTHELIMRDSADIDSEVGGSGDAGGITITANSLQMLDSAEIEANTYGQGNAGKITVEASDVIIRNEANIDSKTGGSGDAGPITVTAKQLLSIDSMDGRYNAGIFSSATSDSSGNAGSINVTAGELRIQGAKGLIDTSTAASGDAGSIVVRSGNVTLTDGGSITSASKGAGHAAGRAGSIRIDATGDVALTQGATISTETIDGFDPDKPASITLTAGNLLLNGNSAITTNANSTDSGDASAGSIDLSVDQAIKLLAGSRLSTESTRGGGGQIEIMVNDLLYLRDSTMTTSVAQGGNQGNGGDIVVDPIFIVLDNSKIAANAIDGNGGNITLVANYINQSTESEITASSELGVDGEITIDAFDAQVDASENSLAADFLDASQWQQKACAQRSGSDVSSFIIIQRPLRPAPHDDWSVSREL